MVSSTIMAYKLIQNQPAETIFTGLVRLGFGGFLFNGNNMDAKAKQCSKCKENLPISAFYKHSSRRSGLTSQCKACHGVRGRRYDQSEKGKAVRGRYKQSPKAKATHKRRNDRVRKEHPEMTKITNEVNRAVLRGDLPVAKSLQCQMCDRQAQLYHHEDYSQIFKVMPLCRFCHQLIHKMIRKEKMTTPPTTGD